MKQSIIDYIRAGYPGLVLVSAEEQRVEAQLKTIAAEMGRALHAWSALDGVVDTASGACGPAQDPMEALEAVAQLPEKTIVLLRDFHLYLFDPNPVLIRQVKDALRMAKASGKTLIMLGSVVKLPVDLERDWTLVEFDLPSKLDLAPVLDGILESAGLPSMPDGDRDKVLAAAGGLTTTEAENALALSVIKTGRIDPLVVASEKALTIKNGGLLEIVSSGGTLDSIGGLDVLKRWLQHRREAFSQRAANYGLPLPKGLLMVGIPGTGKSLTAKATASVFGVPLLKLDAGKLFAGLVGQSESNLRSALQTAEAIAPCVLWLDEVEKGFSGAKGGGDGGTSSRVLGTFLSWMQEKTKPVFVVATANDISQLPPEFLRRGRFDEIMFIDLPSAEDRERIWEIQIRKFARDPEIFDVCMLARATEGFTGSEIEQVFVDTLVACFEAHTEPTDLAVSSALEGFVPLSQLMKGSIQVLRDWSVGRTRRASSKSR